MEDIKVLENFCEVFRMTQRSMDKYEREDYGEIIGQDEIQALENLIARNKELEIEKKADIRIIKNLKEENEKFEKENKVLEGARNWYFEHYTSQACTPEQLRKILTYEFIPKSKVREKIEEIIQKNSSRFNCLSPLNYNATRYAVTKLEQLLQEGDK